ncbi:MAG: DUF4402 domain-containing protein [Bacteroidetes bacterium]|nr:DUF4402 domain-containing protein [Bacteroidota bacterium]MCL5738889.1 DUF4402 domain-containing protein [Bacteroidota bacterium]
MRKILALAVLMTAFAASESFAQSGNASASVAVTVTAQVTVTNVRGLNFGTHVQDSTAATVSANNGGTNAAYFTLQTSASHVSTVTYSNTAMTYSTGTINWTSSVVGSSSAANQLSAATVGNNTTVTTNGSGYYYFWVGGTTDPITNTLPAGAYTGTFTLNVAY